MVVHILWSFLHALIRTCNFPVVYVHLQTRNMKGVLCVVALLLLDVAVEPLSGQGQLTRAVCMNGMRKGLIKDENSVLITT